MKFLLAPLFFRLYFENCHGVLLVSGSRYQDSPMAIRFLKWLGTFLLGECFLVNV